MHLAYLDDAGTDTYSPIAMFGAVIILPDKFGYVESLHSAAIQQIIPPDEIEEKFKEFHAAELFDGSGPFAGIDEEKRLNAIRVLLMAVKGETLPYIYAAASRDINAIEPRFLRLFVFVGGNVTLEEWSGQYRVKMTRGKSGTENLVRGRFGEIADDYGDGLLRLRLLAVPRDRDNMTKALNIRKRQAVEGKLKPLHVTEHVAESVWGFDPNDDRQSKLAIQLVHPKRRRVVVMTDERRAALTATLAAARMKRAERWAA